MTDIAQIAAKLTEAQRRAMSRARFPDYSTYFREHPVFSALQRKGLLEFRHIMAGSGDFHMTPIGLAVAAYLKEQSDD